MSTLTSGKNVNYLQLLEQKLFLKNFSLNYCYCNNSINNFFYFNITSYIFIIFFSYLLILLSVLWCRSKDNMVTVYNLIHSNTLQVYLDWNYPRVVEWPNNRKAIRKFLKELLNIDYFRYFPGFTKIKRIRFTNIFWWEPWSYETLAYFPPFSKKFFNSPWHFYYKYRLSSWIRWHILEDRICIFVLLFLWILI